MRYISKCKRCWFCDITRTTSIIFERSWLSGEALQDRSKSNVMSIFKKDKEEDLRNCKFVNLTSVLGKKMELRILENISEHIKVKKVIWNSQH